MKKHIFSDSFHGTQLQWVPWIFCLILSTCRLGQFSRHLAAVSAIFFFCWLKSYNSAVSTWKRILFSDIFTAPSCREYRGFFDYNYWLITSDNSHGTLLPWVHCFFCWLKYYNCAVLPWKKILFSDTFHGTRLIGFFVVVIYCKYDNFQKNMTLQKLSYFYMTIWIWHLFWKFLKYDNLEYDNYLSV